MTITPRKKPNKPFFNIFLLFAALLVSPSCGDDNLGGAFRAREVNEESKYGPASPLAEGTEHHYTLIASYKRTAESDAGGLTQGEAQALGHVCIKIDELQDIHTEPYKDQSETIIKARVKVTGQSGSTNMFTKDQDNPNATPDEVDNLLSNLWLKSLVGRSQGHGYETPREVVFRTQLAPVPSNFDHGLSVVPFFEARQLEKDLNWSGWTSVGGELEGARNLTNEILKYFQEEPFDSNFMASSTNFRTKITTPPESCSEYTEISECAAANCTWAKPLDSNINSCMRLHRIGFAWRDSISAPATQAGNVLHFVEFFYFDNGTLYKGTEDIRPDTNPDQPLSANFPTANCGIHCQSADLYVKIGFKADIGNPAPCSF